MKTPICLGLLCSLIACATTDNRRELLPLVIAHRGASGYAPENTMAAFRKAVDMGVTEVETDVHLTKDGRLVLLHDHTLDRTTDGTGAPGDFALAELKRLDAGGWFDAAFAGERLIALDELLAAFGDALTYHVELKDPAAGIGAAAAAVLTRFGLAAGAFVTGFDRSDELLSARRAAPALRTCALVSRRDDPHRAVDQAAAAGHDAVSLAASVVTRSLVEHGRNLGLEVRCYGIRDRDDMIAAVRARCNGMTINWPDWLQEWVAGGAE